MLCGWPEPASVLATNDIDALIAQKPDACCYNRLWPNIDELGSPAASRPPRTRTASSIPPYSWCER